MSKEYENPIVVGMDEMNDGYGNGLLWLAPFAVFPYVLLAVAVAVVGNAAVAVNVAYAANAAARVNLYSQSNITVRQNITRDH